MKTPSKTFHCSYHEFNYPQMIYKNMTDDETIYEVINMFKNGCSYSDYLGLIKFNKIIKEKMRK